MRVDLRSVPWLLGVVLALSLTQTTVADEPPEKVKKLMPKDQQETLATLQELQKRHVEAEKVTNRLARKQALDKVKKEADALEGKLAKGMKGWIGQIVITERSVSLTYGGPTRRGKGSRRGDTDVRITVNLTGVSEGVKQEILKLENGDWVTFSISPDGSESVTPRVTINATRRQFSATCDGTVLTSIKKLATE